jgi:uncharacterized protein (DUF2249 family)
MMSQLDVRTIQPRDRHPMIFAKFDALKPGEILELVNDHAPTPLYCQFLHERTGQFEWDKLEEGPETWRVAITRKATNGE